MDAVILRSGGGELAGGGPSSVTILAAGNATPEKVGHSGSLGEHVEEGRKAA